MTFEQTITDMGILSNEVYEDSNQRYFEFDENGQRINSTIITSNNTYTIIDSIDTVNSMQALLLKDAQGKFIIAFSSFPSSTWECIHVKEPKAINDVYTPKHSVGVR